MMNAEIHYILTGIRDAFMVSLFLSGKISILLASIKYQEEYVWNVILQICRQDRKRKYF